MEYCDGGDLYQKIIEHQKISSYLDEEFIWMIFIQATSKKNYLPYKN